MQREGKKRVLIVDNDDRILSEGVREGRLEQPIKFGTQPTGRGPLHSLGGWQSLGPRYQRFPIFRNQTTRILLGSRCHKAVGSTDNSRILAGQMAITHTQLT
jgi:hypothetical protein